MAQFFKHDVHCNKSEFKSCFDDKKFLGETKTSDKVSVSRFFVTTVTQVQNWPCGAT